jgi:hypothetical protein
LGSGGFSDGAERGMLFSDISDEYQSYRGFRAIEKQGEKTLDKLTIDNQEE